MRTQGNSGGEDTRLAADLMEYVTATERLLRQALDAPSAAWDVHSTIEASRRIQAAEGLRVRLMASGRR